VNLSREMIHRLPLFRCVDDALRWVFARVIDSQLPRSRNSFYGMAGFAKGHLPGRLFRS
jgi:hypothetical protein